MSRGRVLNLFKPIYKHINYDFRRHTLESITCAVDKLKVLLDFFLCFVLLRKVVKKSDLVV